MLLYHGTNSKIAKIALVEGLKPRALTGTTNWKHSGNHSNKECVYLTDAYPLYFAINAVKRGTIPAIIEIDTDLLDESLLVPDEDVLEQANRRKDDLPADWSMQKRTKYYRDRLMEYQHAWPASLRAMGTCAYFGEIPAEAIRQVITVDHKVQPYVCAMAMDASMVIMNYQFVGERYKRLNDWIFGREIGDGPEDEAYKALGMPTLKEKLDQLGRSGIQKL